MKKILNTKSIILTTLALVLIVSLAFTLIVVKSDYSFQLKFNDEELNFFDGETLYFNNTVNINFDGSGYTAKLGRDRFKNDITLSEDGTYVLKISKLLKHYTIPIVVNSNPDLYLVDNDGNVIHNYLSNTNSFKVVRNIKDINVYVDNMVYTDDTILDEAGNYLVSTDDEKYTVNILEISK